MAKKETWTRNAYGRLTAKDRDLRRRMEAWRVAHRISKKEASTLCGAGVNLWGQVETGQSFAVPAFAEKIETLLRGAPPAPGKRIEEEPADTIPPSSFAARIEAFLNQQKTAAPPTPALVEAFAARPSSVELELRAQLSKQGQQLNGLRASTSSLYRRLEFLEKQLGIKTPTEQMLQARMDKKPAPPENGA